MITSGEGKYKVWCEKKQLGSDLLFIVGGGEKSHIGSLVICEPHKDPQIIKFDNHYDHEVLVPLAEEGCKKYKTRI